MGKRNKVRNIYTDNQKTNKLPIIIALSVLALLIVGTVVVVVAKPFSKGRSDDAEDFEKEFKQIETVNAELDAVRTSDDYSDKDPEEKAMIVLSILEDQAKAGNIITDSIELDETNHIITYYYTCGILGIEDVGETEECLSGYSGPSQNVVFDKVKTGGKSDKSAEAIILNGLFDTNIKDKDGYKKNANLKDKWDKYGINTALVNDVSLDDLTRLNDYKFIYICMHGIYVDKYKDTFITTNETYNLKTHEKYMDDFLINKDSDNHTSIDLGERIALVNGYYAVTSAFFEAHYKAGALSDSFVFMASCESMGVDSVDSSNDSEAWPNMFAKLSVEAYVGFKNSVYQKYAIEFADYYLKALLDGNTAREAFDKAVKKYGKDDRNSRNLLDRFNDVASYGELHGKPRFRGNENAVLNLGKKSNSTKPAEETQAATSSPTPTPTLTPTPTPAIDMDVLNAAYREILLEYEDRMREVDDAPWGSINSCALTDITGDGFPELIIQYCNDTDMGLPNHIFEYTKILIYTMNPGETTATEILFAPDNRPCPSDGRITYCTDGNTFEIIMLSNGNLLVQTTQWNPGGLHEETYTEYEWDGSTFQEIERLRFYEIYPDDPNASYEIGFYLNDETISDDDYYSYRDDYRNKMEFLLAITDFDMAPADWKEWVSDIPSETLSFDEAWEILN